MLASQFLSVVMDDISTNPNNLAYEKENFTNVEENHRPHDELCSRDYCNSSDSASEDNSGTDATEKGIIQTLKAHHKLPKALLAECCISVVNPLDSNEKQARKCRFDAYVTPVSLPRLRTVPLSRLQEPQIKDIDPLEPNIEALLHGVEAVYSDEGEPEATRDVRFFKAQCVHCHRGFFSDGQTVCRACSKMHLVGNNGEEYIFKGFKCEVCGKCYSQKSVLKKHEAIHSGYRLRCKVCGMDFTQRSSLLRHCKRIHGIMSDSEITTPLVPPDPRQTIGAQHTTARPSLSVSPAKSTHLAIPKPSITVSKTAIVADRTPGPKSIFAPLPPIPAEPVPKFKDQRIAAQELITLDVTKVKPRVGPFDIDPHTAMTITPDFILQMDD